MVHPTHFILVDFQNVTDIDIDRLKTTDAVLLLFLGNNQKKLTPALEKQVVSHPAEVRLIKVQEGGPNSLDKKLAHYLGSLGSRHPKAHFYIVSRDHDFDIAVSCLAGTGIHVARYGAFDKLPIVEARRSGTSKPPFAPTRTAKVAQGVTEAAANVNLESALDGLQQALGVVRSWSVNNRPKKRATLERHLKAGLGNKLSAAEVAQLVDRLIAKKEISVDERGRVTYSSK